MTSSQSSLQVSAALPFFLTAATLSSGGPLETRLPIYFLVGALLINQRSHLGLAAACVGLLVAFLAKNLLTNHDTVIMCVLVTILSSYLYTFWRTRTRSLDLRLFHRSLGAAMRVEFLVFYAWVGVQKLNTHYFDPSLSCVNDILVVFSAAVPFVPIPEWFAVAASYLSVGAEIGALVMILFRPTRKFGILLAVVFHSFLGLLFPAFQLLVCSFLILFIPEETLARAREGVLRRASVSPLLNALLSPLRRSAWYRAVFGIALLIALRLLIGAETTMTAASFVVLASCVCSYACILFAVELRHPPRPSPLFVGLPPLLLVFPLFLFFQGLQPHLGFKAVQSFAMFSNLDTHAGQSNHLFIPASLQISDNLSDAVVIHRTNVDDLIKATKSAGEHDEISYAHLRQLISKASRAGERDLRVEYSHRGVRRTVYPAELDSELSTASLVERVYLKHYPIATSHHGRCRW